MKKLGHVIAIIVLIILSTLGLRFLLRYIFALPMAASGQAQPIDVMFNIHFWMISFLFSMIMVIMIYSSFVFRREPGDESDGPFIHGNRKLEVGWTVVPMFVVIGFGIYGAIVLNEITRPIPGEMAVEVTGKQWVWTFHYPELEEIASGELVLPVNQPVVLNMNAEDVIHSFWVPEFRVKQDLVPGRETHLRITPTVIGDYALRCAEICGLGHTQMEANVRILSAADFDAWVAQKQAAPKFGEMTPEERGAFWASAEGFGCIACHSADGTPGAGPTWQGLYGHDVVMTDGSTVTADDAYITESILDPNAKIVEGFNPNIMPQTFGEQFAAKEAEIQAAEAVDVDIVSDLIAYIKTLQ